MFDKIFKLFRHNKQDTKQLSQTPEEAYGRLTPDALYNKRGPGTKTFFYAFQSPLTGKPELRVGNSPDTTHYDMLTNPEHGPHLFPDDRWKSFKEKYPGGGAQILPGQAESPRQQATHYTLAGRLGTIDGHELVIFWNTDAQQLNQYMTPCLKELVKQGHVTKNALVSTPVVSKATPITSYLGGETFQADVELTPEERTALWSKLHLMSPEQKKATMKRLGLGGEDMKTHQYVDKARELGVPNPDNLTWRGTSESFKEWLQQIEKSLDNS